MNAVAQLASLLGAATPMPDWAPPATRGLDDAITALQRHARAGSHAHVPGDLQHDAVMRFRETLRFETLRDARLVSFGLCLAAGRGEQGLIDDTPRFEAVLRGVEQWADHPRWFRRCYQGLLRGYFGYDPEAPDATLAGRRNWRRLREYLAERLLRIVDPQANPDWVKTAVASRHLYTDAPCAPYAGAALRGETSGLDALCERLGITSSSWFLRQLLQAQIAAATALGDDEFGAVLPRLLDSLSGNRMLRDAGLAMLLNRHAQAARAVPHTALCEAAAHAWGLPWVAANALNWRTVSEAACGLAADGLKAVLIETFFGRLAGDGALNRRRAAFWLRYVKAMRQVQFALCEPMRSGDAHESLEPLGAMAGLVAAMQRDAPADHALIMTMGSAVIVEFTAATAAPPASAAPDALYGYDLRARLPFDTAQPLNTTADAANSLRASRPALRIAHRDGVDGWRQWEQQCEAALKQHFDIRPGMAQLTSAGGFIDLSDSSATDPLPVAEPLCVVVDPKIEAGFGEDVHWQTAEAALVPYSRPDLEVLARVHALRLDDRAAQGGKLWVRADAGDERINRILTRWGFAYEPGAGWCQ